MGRFSEIRSRLIKELVDAGEIIPRGEDIYEDMGGHLVHESNLDGYIDSYLRGMSGPEREALIRMIGGEEV